MNCSRNAKSEIIFSNDFALEKFAEQLVSSWVLSKDKPVTRKEFREWLKTFNILLNSTADEYFKRVEIIKNKGVNE